MGLNSNEQANEIYDFPISKNSIYLLLILKEKTKKYLIIFSDITLWYKVCLTVSMVNP